VIGLFFLMLLFSAYFHPSYVMAAGVEGQVRAEGRSGRRRTWLLDRAGSRTKASKAIPQVEPATAIPSRRKFGLEFYHARESKATDEH